MTSTARFNFAARLKLPQSNYVCIHCRLQTSSALRTANASTPLPYDFRRHASWVDTTKLRKRIFGTGVPPGQKNPNRKTENGKQEEVEDEELESMLEEEGEPKYGNRYIRATRADKLEHVGGVGWGDEDTRAEEPFRGFMNSKRINDEKGIADAIHRAFKEAGLPLVLDRYSKNHTAHYPKRVARGAKFEKDANGTEETPSKMVEVPPQEPDDNMIEELQSTEQEALEEELKSRETEETSSVWGDNETSLESKDSKVPLLDDDPQERDDNIMDEPQSTEQESLEKGLESRGTEETPSEMVEGDDETNLKSEDSAVPLLDDDPLDPAELSDLAAFVPASDTWRDVSLDNAAIKFAVLKRVMQLTGRRIPDPDISAITTPKSLFDHLVKKPKAKRIADALLDSNTVTRLPNVQLLNKRYTMIDREIEIGRWKVIEEELKKKNLPIPGSADSRQGKKGNKDGMRIR